MCAGMFAIAENDKTEIPLCATPWRTLITFEMGFAGVQTGYERLTPFLIRKMFSTEFWSLVKGAMTFNPESFQVMADLPNANQIAIQVLLLAGFSQAVGQGLILFVNRVKPVRFGLSLCLGAILFVFSYGFWIGSTFLISRLLFQQALDFREVYHTVGLATAPQILSFLIALPYFGVPIQIGLALWALLVFVQGFSVSTGFGLWQSFICGLLGWIFLQILQRTLGRPIGALGTWLSNTTAGTHLVTDLQGIETLLETGLQGDVSYQGNRK